jgi:beta-glucosidase
MISRALSLALLTALAATSLAGSAGPQTSMKALSTRDIDAIVDPLIAAMTLDEKIAMLHGAQDPERVGQAGYLPGVPRLHIPAMRLSDGPAGVRTGKPATALPAPVAMAATFSTDLARRYGQVIGQDARALRQDVILAPMVNIVRVPQGGRNFETLGEDPVLASTLVAAEIDGIQREGVMATIKHFAMNNQENVRQSVSADVDERTMHEIELPGFEAAVRAGVASVMASYNKVNGTWASENADLETKILRDQWHFEGFVMSDWGATHSTAPALTAGLELEMPGGGNYMKIPDAIKAGDLTEAVVNRAVRRILVEMARFGMLAPGYAPKTAGTIPATSADARDIAIAGAVLLKNDNHVLPLAGDDLKSLAVIGPTARTLLVGGGGSARVPPMHTGSVLDRLQAKAGTAATIAYAVGYDLDGEPIPAPRLTLTGAATSNGTIDFTGARALAAGSTSTWTGTLTADTAGDYEIRLQTSGGRGTIAFDQPAPPADNAAGAGGRGAGGGPGRGGRGGGGGAAGLLPTALGLNNPVTMAHFDAGQSKPITVSATAGAQAPIEIRLAWIPPGWREKKIAEAADAARRAHTAVVFAYDEGSEGRDRPSLSLPGGQDALIAAVAAANPRTVVVLNNGAPILMPWADSVAGILQMWYPGQEGADATSAILTGEAAPGGRLPVTFPKRAEDAPTADPARYPGVNGHGAYSEGIFVGYRWYDAQNIAPLFPFGHGLTYTTFEYTNLRVTTAADGGNDVRVTIRNSGTRAGSEVVQAYVGPPPSPPVPMATRALAAFARVTLEPGRSQDVTMHIDPRAWRYWSNGSWTVAGGTREVMLGASSRDIRLKTPVIVK